MQVAQLSRNTSDCPPRETSSTSRPVRKAAFKFVFATLLVAVAFAATYTSSETAFPESDLRDILVLGGTVNTVLLLDTLFFLRSRVIANIVLSLIVMASVATAHIIHTDLYLVENQAVLIALCAGSGAGLFVAFRLIDELRWGGPALSAAALLGLGTIAGGHLGTSDVPEIVDTTYIRDISFRETPNLYFVSFDAMAPRALLKKYLALETTKFHDLFDSSFRRFPNFFANSVMTRDSLNTVLALDVDAYLSQRRELATRGEDPEPFLFSGQNRLISLESFTKTATRRHQSIQIVISEKKKANISTIILRSGITPSVIYWMLAYGISLSGDTAGSQMIELLGRLHGT